MPTIPTTSKKKKTNNNQPTDMRRLRQKAYQSPAWRKLRDSWIKMHPLCEECLLEGKVTPAEDVHHVRSPFKNGQINYQLLLDENNLISLCKKHHAEIHNRQQGKTTAADVLRVLAELLEEKEVDNDNFGNN